LEHLISAREAAELIGVSLPTVKAWVFRKENPLPSIQVGESGKHRRIVRDSIAPWLEAEATRTAISS
jgi:excisionase family DNA binding protein